MNRGRVLAFGVWCGAVLATTGLAQEPSTGVGQSIPASFRSFVAVDDRYPPKKAPAKKPEDRDPRDRTNKIHDLVVEAGLNPTLAVFTRAAPAPDAAAARLMKAVNDQFNDPVKRVKLSGSSFGAFVIFLRLEKEYPFDDRYVGGDPKNGFVREDEATKLRAFADQVAAPRIPVGLAAGDSEQTKAWGIAADAETVVVLYNRMKVVGRWTFPAGTPPTDADVQKIVDAAVKEAGQ